jgi:hypothetical protein
VGDFLSSSHNTDLVEGTDFRGEAAVDTQDPSINNSSQGHEIEDLGARLPHRRISVLLHALLVEPVDLSNLAGLVVATDKSDAIRVSERH